MNGLEVLKMMKEIIEEVKEEMDDRRPEIQVAAQFAAARMFDRLNKIYDFKKIDGLIGGQSED